MRERDDSDEEAGDKPSGFSLDRALSAVRRRYLLVLAVMVTVAIIAVTFAQSLPNRYEATALVQVDPRHKTVSNIDGVLSELKADSATVESEVEIIASRSVSLRVIDLLDLRYDDEFGETSRLTILARKIGLLPPLPRPPPKPTAAEPDPIGSLLGALSPNAHDPAAVSEKDPVAFNFSSRLKVSRVRTSLLIEIRYASQNAYKAARIANAIAHVYLEDQLKAKQHAAGAATEALEGKIDAMRLKVAEAERKVERFKADHGIFNSEGQILSEKHLARLMEQTVIARNNSAETRAKFELTQKMLASGDDSGSLAEVLQSQTIRLLKEKAATAAQRAAELATKYGPRHPEMQKVEADVRETKANLNAEISRLVENLRNEYDVAAQREREMSESLTALKDREVATKDDSVELKDLEREASTSKQLFESLLLRYKQMAETQSLQLADSRIIQEADVPLFLAGPKRNLIMFGGWIGGLVAGVALALGFEFATRGLARPDDVGRLLDLEHLASLPAIVEGAQGSGADEPLRAVRRIVAEPGGAFAEAVRAARREIDGRRSGTGPRLILVASALPGEGGGHVASNLAHHYALTGIKVLLVDGDLRRGALTRLLSPTRISGLIECIGTATPVESAILRDANTGLNFLPAIGPAPSNLSPAEIVASRAMAAELARLRTLFEVIVLEAPPLLPVMDGRILADYADAIVFTMAWRRTPVALAKRALSNLGLNARKVLGVVMTDVDPAIIADGEALGFHLSSGAPTARAA